MDDKSFDCFNQEKSIAAIAAALKVAPGQVRAAAELLAAGGTIPFIARYRKEATRGLDEQALRAIDESLAKARELADRKATILKTIDGQGQLTDALRRQIEDCGDKRELEDLYLPFKPKRRTRATIARERGLEPLAEILLRQELLGRPRSEILRPYVAPEREVPDEAAALAGACDIVAEHWSEDAPTRGWLAGHAAQSGNICSKLRRGKQEEAAKFEMYFDHQEPCRRVPSHRFLAMQRGEAEQLLRVSIVLDDEEVLRNLKQRFVRNPQFEFHRDLLATVEDCYRRLLLPATETAVLQDLKEKADAEAIAVFARNLRELLLAPPAGPKVTIGIDPGFRTGCKVAVVDGTGKHLANTTIYPTPPRNDVEQAEQALAGLIDKYGARLIAIGNGTASRETDAFVTAMLRQRRLEVTKVVVSESGASIYSASETAAREHPDLDVTVRGALSIARRLQDPLAELVKIDPKAIGVGQYQHDVNQSQLKKTLDWEVESCVNSVGVDANMASASLLSYVAGIGPKLAERIVAYRDANGRFESREAIREVPKLGPKAFEQAAGFLRIRDGSQPLDNSAVHPESYHVVEKMAARLSVAARQLVGNAALAAKLRAEDFVEGAVGLPTVRDILAELAKPGRDPRSEFKVARFAEGVQELDDLREGMILEGVVTNVTRFGAFVDIGVHQDGLVHISQLANKFVQDPSEVVSVGDVVKVKVLEVDLDRRRVALSRKQCLGPGG
ncbi:MAG: Tex family protein [Thermoguttaceae bacterium]|jgi:uncharacterized protein